MNDFKNDSFFASQSLVGGRAHTEHIVIIITNHTHTMPLELASDFERDRTTWGQHAIKGVCACT